MASTFQADLTRTAYLSGFCNWLTGPNTGRQTRSMVDGGSRAIRQRLGQQPRENMRDQHRQGRVLLGKRSGRRRHHRIQRNSYTRARAPIRRPGNLRWPGSYLCPHQHRGRALLGKQPNGPDRRWHNRGQTRTHTSAGNCLQSHFSCRPWESNVCRDCRPQREVLGSVDACICKLDTIAEIHDGANTSAWAQWRLHSRERSMRGHAFGAPGVLVNMGIIKIGSTPRLRERQGFVVRHSPQSNSAVPPSLRDHSTIQLEQKGHACGIGPVPPITVCSIDSSIVHRVRLPQISRH